MAHARRSGLSLRSANVECPRHSIHPTRSTERAVSWSNALLGWQHCSRTTSNAAASRFTFPICIDTNTEPFA